MQETPAKAPTAPTAPVAPEPYVVNVNQLGGATTGEQVRALRIKIDDLQEQLQDAASRRQTVNSRLLGSDSKGRPGLEARLGELDSRILRIEKDISQATQQLSNATPAALVAGTQGMPRDVMNNMPNEIVPIVAILSVFVLGPFAIAMARLIWKRGSVVPARPAAIDQATQQRLEQLQQSVDTIAIEVERISEGQRFVTKLMSERPALGAGAAEPVRAAKKSAVPSERG